MRGVIDNKRSVRHTRIPRTAVHRDEPSDVLILNISNSVSGRGICGKHRGSIEFFIAVDTLFGDKFEWVAKTDIDVRVNKIVPIQY